jgi:hypothetical protein
LYYTQIKIIFVLMILLLLYNIYSSWFSDF